MERTRQRFEQNLREKLQQKSTPHMTQQTVLQRAFKYFDLDNSGCVSFTEWSKAVEKIGVILSPGQQQALFRIYDIDNSKSLDYRQFTSSVFGASSSAARSMASQKHLNEADRNHAINLLKEIRQILIQRGLRGLIGLSRQFRIMDDDNSGFLSLAQFSEALQDFRLDLKDSEKTLVFRLVDRDNSGFINYEELVFAIIGDLSDQRKQIVVKAFDSLDKEGTGQVDIEYLKLAYNPSNLPQVLAMRKSVEDLMTEFIDTFQMFHSLYSNSNLVNIQEFIAYFAAVSACIDNDNDFQETISNVWGLQRPHLKPVKHNISQKQNTRQFLKKPANTKSVQSIVQKLRKRLAQRGARGILGFSRQFKIMDDDGSRHLDYAEFQKGCNDFRVGLDQREIDLLFKAIDSDNSGSIDYQEFLRIVRGPMNSFRRNLVEKAWEIIDLNGDGVLEVADIRDKYDASHHPQVQAGRKTTQDVLGEFIDTFELHHSTSEYRRRDHRISKEQFFDYYSNISASIDNDNYFQLMMNRAWNIDKQNYDEPWAGSWKSSAFVNHKQQWLEDHHRGQIDGNLLCTAPFGTDATPTDWSTSNRDSSRALNQALLPAAGQPCWSSLANPQSVVEPSLKEKSTDQIIRELKNRIIDRGQFGFISFTRKLMEYEKQGGLSLTDFESAMADYRLRFDEEELRKVFRYLDVDKSGKLSCGEIVSRVRGEMTSLRKQLVLQAFQKLDPNGTQNVQIQTVCSQFKPELHPDVSIGKHTEDEVLVDFIESFKTHHSLFRGRDPNVSEEEFLDYYSCVSPAIEDDRFFELMIKNSWNFENRERERTHLAFQQQFRGQIKQ